MNTSELQEKVERRYLQILISLLRTGSIDLKTTNESARVLLSLEPVLAIDDARAKIEFFVNKYPVFKDLEPYIGALDEEEKTKHIVDEMHKHLKANNIDAALSIVQKTHG